MGPGVVVRPSRSRRRLSITRLAAHNPGPYTGEGTNTYLIAGHRPVLIDAGTGSPAHLAELARHLSRAVDEPGSGEAEVRLRVLVTHGHADHASGAEAIRDRWPDTVCAKMPWPGRDERYSVPWVPLRDGERVPAGDGHLRVVHTPGHAPDHLCFLDEETGTLFAGDLAIADGTVVIPASQSGSLSAYLASLERILALSPARLLPGHGPAIDEPRRLLRGYLMHRRRREAQVIAALREGRHTLEAMVERIYEPLDVRLRAAAGESILAHLMKLEGEGAARRAGSDWWLS